MIDICLSFMIALTLGFYPFLIKYANNFMSIHTIMLILSGIWFISTTIFCLLIKTDIRKDLKFCFQERYIPLLLVILIGFFGIFLGNLIQLYIIKYSNHLNIAIAIISLSSVVSFLYSLFILKIKFNKCAIVGILLTAVGVFTMIVSIK